MDTIKIDDYRIEFECIAQFDECCNDNGCRDCVYWNEVISKDELEV